MVRTAFSPPGGRVWHGPGGRGARQLGVMPRIAGSVRARPRCSLAWTNRSGLKMIMSNRYLSAMSRSTAPISEPGRIFRHGRHLLAAQPAARRADRHPDLRIAADPLDLAGGGVGLHQEPAVPLDEPHRGGDAPAVALVAGDTEVPAAEHGRGGGRLIGRPADTASFMVSACAPARRRSSGGSPGEGPGRDSRLAGGLPARRTERIVGSVTAMSRPGDGREPPLCAGAVVAVDHWIGRRRLSTPASASSSSTARS